MEDFISFVSQLGTKIGLKLLYAILILVIGLKLVNTLTKALEKSKGFKKIDSTVRSFLKSFISIALKVTVVVSAAITIGIPASTFVTIIASAGVAIGLALQGSLSNLAGGLMILLFKPFKVGDYVQSGGNEGTVKSITIFYTVLTTADNKTITLPNGTLTNSTIVNLSANDTRRVDLVFCASYNADVETVKKILLDECDRHPLVLKEPEPFARLSEHADSSLNFTLRVWCKGGDYWTVYFDLMENVKKSFDENHIEIPYPQVDVHIDK